VKILTTPTSSPVRRSLPKLADACWRDECCEIRLGRGEISSGCCYADPGNVALEPLNAAASTAPDRIVIAENQQRRRRSESRQRGRPW
jgi:hypothetical protein